MLTGSMTDLVAANGMDKILAGNLAWVPSCAAGADSFGTVNSGTADAALTRTTPQFIAAGAYTGTLTLTLI
ncbi:hypothetical protein [Yinghuangia aomiensis]|uniref:hypothetical protein n=1 Tax=Yinghuangia aomiensis TaxID=676205 RepID=UPI0031EBA434